MSVLNPQNNLLLFTVTGMSFSVFSALYLASIFSHDNLKEIIPFHFSSSDSRDASDDMFGQQQQQQGNNFIPQIVMNPWDPSQAPVMTLAPLANVANAMQAAYHQQMLLQQQASRNFNNRSRQVFLRP